MLTMSEEGLDSSKPGGRTLVMELSGTLAVHNTSPGEKVLKLTEGTDWKYLRNIIDG